MASRLIHKAKRKVRSKDFLQKSNADFSGNAFATSHIELLKTKVTQTGDFQEQQISSDGSVRQNYEIVAQANLKQVMRDAADFAATTNRRMKNIKLKYSVNLFSLKII